MVSDTHSPTSPDDRAFDMLKAVADHAEAHGLRRTASLAEAAMDAWLVETRGVSPIPVRLSGRRAPVRRARQATD